MKYLYTLSELLAMRTNGWSCECGKAYLDGPAVAVPVAPGDPDCQHKVLRRATLTPAKATV